ncbi:trypsin-like serine protease [Micromonospora sp. KC207]|uniref:S1 family peptidase n=1 Tax=Micromonospora sp. KC207 TaxID=2530377 RepID=UPI0010448239|nr:S1 family peptidase [Micromonospora sp. KC207]TDC64101.1 trypsin-like serine protease [Micromonospora sp. KC207]
MRSRLTTGGARVVALGLLVTGAVVAAPTSASADTAVTGDVPATATAVAVFTGEPADTAIELPAREAAALETAEARAEGRPDALAPPFYDPGTARVSAPVVSTGDVTAVPYAAAAIPISNLVDESGVDETVPGEAADKEEPTTSAATRGGTVAAQAIPTLYYPATPAAKYSLSRLSAVRDEVLTAGLVGQASMYSAYVDAPRNRVVVEASAVTEGMRNALATRYAADLVALRLTPGETAGVSQARHNDTSPFYGGAKMGPDGCTIGFGWTHQGARYFVTAGHCTTASQNVYMDRYSSAVGKVIDDNWNNSTGSVKINGASYYSGDLSLVKMNSGFGMTARMWTGGPTSSTNRPVAGPASRSPKIGDKYCTGGSTKGSICNWKVVATGTTVRYDDGTVARNMTKGTKHGHCTAPGDSGGPIFTINSAGKIVAKGIHSGGGGGGGDHFTGSLESPCREWFTDIRLAEKILPGIIYKY